MENLEKILEIIFKRVAAKSVLDRTVSARNFKQSDFTRISFAYSQSYSQPELDNMWSFYKDAFVAERRNYGYRDCWEEKGFNVFDAVRYFAERILTIQDNEILCLYNEIQRWRKLTLQVSEDLLICAYCAATKTPKEMETLGFSWQVVIGHNNVRLNRILERGISENHFHLYGSAPIFHLSWISMMNYIREPGVMKALTECDRRKKNLNIHYGSDYEEDSLKLQCYEAALIRLILFSKVMDIPIKIGNYDSTSDSEDKIWYILRNEYELEGIVPELQSVITTLRNVYFYREYKEEELIDYALQGVKDSFEDSNDVFSGERWIIYLCFNKIYKREFNESEENLFYLYILLKESIRSELIQANEKVGFINFQEYQSRKAVFIQRSIFNKEYVQRAARDAILEKNIKSMELRIVPKDTVKQNLKQIQKLDRLIGEPRDKYFYTVHFIKKTDEKDYTDEYVQCRHSKCRISAKKTAHALIGLRETYPETAMRIRGIDAASNEIGCRPEVFAEVFRYLRGHVKMIDDGGVRKYIPQLRVTYHVGEDFLDVADGLRAIDEAINFLDMDCGDRLGHALALGIDVEEWYKSKNNYILLPQQDYLDNLVWIYNRLIQFNIQGMDALKDEIQKKYERYFYEIYGKYINADEIEMILKEAEKEHEHLGIATLFGNDRYRFDIGQYYDSWKLRGDDPLLYSHGYFKWEDDDTLEAKAKVNRKFPQRFEVRYMPAAFLLYYYYHFNNDVRKAGKKRISVHIRPNYIKAVKCIQKEMQNRIAHRGLGIETNPSSNYVIGTFKNYAKHPIFNFYNKGLTYDPAKLDDCAQLSVSVNTDDQGVFATSLENEYALLASALEEQRDENGKYIYNKTMVYDWIDDVRRMGNEQSFLAMPPEKERQEEEKRSSFDEEDSFFN